MSGHEASRHPYTQLLRLAAPNPPEHFGTELHFEARGDPPDLTNLPPGCPFAPGARLYAANANTGCRPGDSRGRA
jgi:peptide/nickel transport system ATP-binding protein